MRYLDIDGERFQYLADAWERNDRPTSDGMATHDGGTLATMARLCAQAANAFALRTPDAPGLVFLGGELGIGGSKRSVTGTGLGFEDAVLRLGGEIAEVLALDGLQNAITVARLADVVTGWPEPWRAELVSSGATLGPDGNCRVVPGRLLTTGRPIAVPMALLAPPDGLGPVYREGCAAAATIQAATTTALLEAVERHLAMRWWHGDQEGALVQLDGAARVRIDAHRHQLRQGQTTRQDRLVHLGRFSGASVVAAVSFDDDGGGFACGTAARPHAVDAIEAAYRELCQMEVGLRMAMLKRAQLGEAALSAGDRRQLRRAAAIRAETPGRTAPDREVWVDDAEEQQFDTDKLVVALAQHGHPAVAVPLPVDVVGCVVVKVVVPGLHLSDARGTTPLLAEQLDRGAFVGSADSPCPLY